MDVVPFAAEHLHQVAELLRAHASPELDRDPARFRHFIEANYLDPPSRVAPISSLVAVADDGSVAGFCGVTPSPMTWRGEPLLLAASGPLIADPTHRAKAPGLFLSRAMLNGPQDLSITDGANDDATALWLRLRAEVVSLPSMRWLRPLRPSGLALSLASDRIPAIRPLIGKTSLLDRAAMSRFAPADVDTTDAALSGVALAELTERVAPDFALTPAYRPDVANWQLREMRAVTAKGTLMARSVLRDGQPIGWFIYYLEPDGLCRVLQVGCRKRDAAAVIAHLCHHAASRNGGALFGRFESHYWDAIRSHPIITARNAPRVLIHAADAELRADIHAGRALLTRLEGEAWNGLHHQPLP